VQQNRGVGHTDLLRPGEVDIETCLCCIDLRDVINDGDESSIVCTPGATAQRRNEQLAIRW
jgi:hypothetical protein